MKNTKPVLPRSAGRPASTLFKRSAGILASVAVSSVNYASSDYGPAIWNPPCNANYYTGGYGHKFHVCHDMEGYYLATISLFDSCGWTSASVHYAVNGKQDTSSDHAAGEITQMISESNYAWHVLCWNQFCTGTEHEGFASNPAWYTSAMYSASAGITRHIASKFGFPVDRNHIVGHNEWQNANWRAYAGGAFGINTTCNTHTDPGVYWDWSTYMNLVKGSPSQSIWGPVGHNQDGRMEVYAVGTDNAVWDDVQSSDNGGFYGFGTMGGTLSQSRVIATENADGRLQIFSVGTDNNVYTKWQTAPNAAYSGWAGIFQNTVAIQPGSLVAGYNADGRIQVFGVGTNQAVYTSYQTTVNGSFSSWLSLGGILSTNLAVGGNADGRIQLFALGTDGNVYTVWQTAPNGAFSSWAGVGSGIGIDGNLEVGSNADGRLQLFAHSANGAIYTLWQTSPNGGFSNWLSLGGILSNSLAVARNADGRLQIFSVGTNGTLYSQWQTSDNGPFSSWTSLGGSITPEIAAGINQDGRIQVFALGTNGGMYTTWQTVVNGGFSTWGSMATGGFSTF